MWAWRVRRDLPLGTRREQFLMSPDLVSRVAEGHHGSGMTTEQFRTVLGENRSIEIARWWALRSTAVQNCLAQIVQHQALRPGLGESCLVQLVDQALVSDLGVGRLS